MAKRTTIQPGTIFGLSEIISELEGYKPDAKYKRYFKIKCLNCGGEGIKELKDLKKENRPRTCGNCNYWGGETRDIKPGDNYFGYVIIKELPNKGDGNRRVLVYDLEGNKKDVSYKRLKAGILFNGVYNHTHGMTNTRFYRIYAGMLCRCNTPSASHYSYYGGRGIKCEWNNFEDFKKDMYESYLEHCLKYGIPDTTIDRIDSDGNYCKDNCRWATRKEQIHNRRK